MLPCCITWLVVAFPWVWAATEGGEGNAEVVRCEPFWEVVYQACHGILDYLKGFESSMLGDQQGGSCNSKETTGASIRSWTDSLVALILQMLYSLNLQG